MYRSISERPVYRKRSYLVQPCRVVGVTANLQGKVCNDPQFGVVARDVDVEALHVVRGAIPPLA